HPTGARSQAVRPQVTTSLTDTIVNTIGKHVETCLTVRTRAEESSKCRRALREIIAVKGHIGTGTQCLKIAEAHDSALRCGSSGVEGQKSAAPLLSFQRNNDIRKVEDRNRLDLEHRVTQSRGAVHTNRSPVHFEG